jgi:L-fuconolactonase
MPSADAHLHLFADGFHGRLGSSPAGGDELVVYEHLRHHHGIQRGLVLGFEGEQRYLGNSDHVLSLARTRPWMAPLAYLPVSPPPTASRLVALRDQGAIGFAVYPSSQSEGGMLSEWPAAPLAEMRRQRALVSINAEPPATARMGRFIGALDGCTVIFSHLGSPGQFAHAPKLTVARELLGPLLAFAARDTVTVKFSGLYGISDPDHDFPHRAAQPFVDVILEAFGPSRLLWGSDFSPVLDFVSFAQAADSRLLSACDAAEIDAVMGGNLLRLLAIAA